MPMQWTKGQQQDAERAYLLLQQAKNTKVVRQIFRDHYTSVGWKALCRMFVLEQSPEEALRLTDGFRQHHQAK